MLVYVYVTKEKVAKTKELVAGSITIDFDKDGNIIGVEILDAKLITVEEVNEHDAKESL